MLQLLYLLLKLPFSSIELLPQLLLLLPTLPNHPAILLLKPGHLFLFPFPQTALWPVRHQFPHTCQQPRDFLYFHRFFELQLRFLKLFEQFIKFCLKLEHFQLELLTVAHRLWYGRLCRWGRALRFDGIHLDCIIAILYGGKWLIIVTIGRCTHITHFEILNDGIWRV